MKRVFYLLALLTFFTSCQKEELDLSVVEQEANLLSIKQDRDKGDLGKKEKSNVLKEKEALNYGGISVHEFVDVIEEPDGP